MTYEEARRIAERNVKDYIDGTEEHFNPLYLEDVYNGLNESALSDDEAEIESVIKSFTISKVIKNSPLAKVMTEDE